VFAVTTTAGTGSEANPYAILTLDGEDLKKTYNYNKSYAQTAFLDPKYTRSMPYSVTVGTALDALCHCIESWLNVKSTPLSAIHAELGIKKIYKNLELLFNQNDKSRGISDETREDLLLGALCGGIAINTTGTCFPHPMGYNLTLLNGLPHGKANAIFIGEFLRLNEEAANDNPALAAILKEMYAAFNAPLEKICEVIDVLNDYHAKFDDKTLKFYVSKISGVKNY
jgi:alcohol dehydrogenase class IV